MNNSDSYKILEVNINGTVSSLIILTKEKCWNKISDKYLYILTDINEFEYVDFHELRTKERKINSEKVPKDIDTVLKFLSEIYSDLYDVNCYIFKSKKDCTIIEIQYFRKSDLDSEYLEKVRGNRPMYHAKMLLPPNKRNDLEKFDVNWNNDGII
ncbi:hypothetical protein [Chryseobacterium sp. 3008163]|uniref:hypothetical protein n=1 Tax=Chryseobacterium sp. 3008163 TaxID=2478663 RepID=UPI000F0C49A4|nr:hypothetical protein [Chryseobacterium sp. 3008163]AYN02347.1 hypothetical protein EAG08_20380 [Chryseobacterium sp. 3008163]